MALEAETRPLRVCFFGTFRDSYVRNEVMINGLRAAGAAVHVCHATLWRGVADRVEQAGGGWRRPAFWRRVLGAYWRLLRAHWAAPDYDVMLVGYPGQFDSLLGRLLSGWRRRPMALDVLMSLHLIAEERGLTARSPFTGRLIFALEKLGLHRPAALIVDTPEYRDYYAQKYDLPLDRFHFVPLGVDDRLYQPRPDIQPPSDMIRVIYYGTFIPLHGVPTMLRAAALLKDEPHIHFDFYGEGQELPAAEALAAELALDNLTFHGWLDKAGLPAAIAASHISLGVFGTTKQSLCTIQNKIWEGMMMERAVISGDAATIRAELTHGDHLYLVDRADPAALAAGIRDLAGDAALRARLGRLGHERAQANTIAATGRRALAILEAVAGRGIS